MKSSNRKTRDKSKSNFQRWSSRFSAGGANRTNVHHQIQRLSREHDVQSSRLPRAHQPYSSGRLPYDRYSYQRGERQHSYEDEDLSLSNFRDEKGHQLQRVGLFRNAKHSDLVHPKVDERVMRNAEAKILRLTRRESGEDGRYDERSINPVRERVRRVVYDMSRQPTEKYRDVGRRRAEVVAKQLVFSPPPRRFRNPHRNVLYDSGYEPRSFERRDDDYELDVFDKPSSSRQNWMREKSPQQWVPRDNYRCSPSPRPPPPPPSKQHRYQHQKRERTLSINSPFSPVGKKGRGNKKVMKARSDVSDNDTDELEDKEKEEEVNISDDERERPRSRSSDVASTIKKANPIYVPEDDEFSQWKKAAKFMNDLDGEASSIIDRIGNAMPFLPLSDSSEKCYSKIAFALISKSLHNQVSNEKKTRAPISGDVFTNLVNMSTSWAVPSKQYSTILAGGGGGDFEEPINNNEVFGNISKFQDPQNLFCDDSKFPTNSRFLENSQFKVPKMKDTRKRPLFQSSPFSKDSVRSDELGTFPSEILNHHEDEQLSESEEARGYELDDYIDKGASQLSYIATPEIQSTSKTTFMFNNSSQVVPETAQVLVEEKERNDLGDVFNHANVSMKTFDFEQQPSSYSKTFDFMFSNEKLDVPAFEVDAQSQKVFEEAFEEYQAQQEAERNKRSKFQF